MADLLVLGLDIASRTGWALSDGRYGAFEGGDTTGHSQACGAFGDWLSGFITENQPSAVVVEGLVKGGIGFNAKAFKMAGVAAYICQIREIAMTEYAPCALKKYATGKGNARKPDMIAAANKRFGVRLTENQDDEADALFLAAWGAENVREEE